MELSSIQISVIIPARNEQRYIGKCLHSVLANDVQPEQLEILVADGRSGDQTRAIVREIAATHANVRLVDNPKRIVSAALNLGIREAKGKYIFILGAHAEYPPNYLRTCIEELQRTKADVVGGTLRTQPGADTHVAKAIALLSQHPFGVGNSGFRIGWGDRFVDTVPYPAYNKDVFLRVGFYNESLVRHQDFELNSRIRAAGGRIFLSSKVQNTYYNVPTLYHLARQAFGNGLWLGRAWVRHPVSFSCRHAVPLLFVLAVLGTALLGLFAPAVHLLAVFILVLYAVLAVRSAAQLAWHHGLKFFPVLPGLFFVHHFAYGLGTTVGLLTWHAQASIQNPLEEGV
jgi:glycosyltransferase involved in cell wall biosynthesis